MNNNKLILENMNYVVKVSIFDYERRDAAAYQCEEARTTINFNFTNTEDMYETLITYARDFTNSFTYLDEWFCISTMDEGGVTIIEFKDYEDYLNDIKLPIRELPNSEDIYDERTSK